jgi:hypothetical protein
MANLAGLSGSVQINGNSIMLNFSGYNDKIEHFIQEKLILIKNLSQ